MIDVPVIPPRVRAGDAVAIVSPSLGGVGRWPHRATRARAYLESLGLRPRLMPNAARDDGWASASPRERADDIHAAFLDDEVSVVLASIGGLHSNQLLPHLDPELIAAHPKVLQGYSDVTVLLWALAKHAGLRTFHGPALIPEPSSRRCSDTPTATCAPLGSVAIRSPSSPRASGRTSISTGTSGPTWRGLGGCGRVRAGSGSARVSPRDHCSPAASSRSAGSSRDPLHGSTRRTRSCSSRRPTRRGPPRTSTATSRISSSSGSSTAWRGWSSVGPMPTRTTPAASCGGWSGSAPTRGPSRCSRTSTSATPTRCSRCRLEPRPASMPARASCACSRRRPPTALASGRARPADLEALAAVQLAGWRAAFVGIVPRELEPTAEHLIERLQEHGADPSRCRVVAERDGALAGFCTFGPSRDADAGAGVGEIHALFVDPAAWRRRIGTALVLRALYDLRAGGFEEVTLWSFAEGARANAFYKRRGFSRDGGEQSRPELGHARELRYRRSLRSRLR